MRNSQTFGKVRERATHGFEYLTLAFSPLSVPLRSRWRNNGLSADFLGDYVVTFLPREDGEGIGGARQNEIRHAVIYIANELLENAMKYHHHDEEIPIGIHMELTSGSITVSASNGIDSEQTRHYQHFIEELSRDDAGELLIKQLEENAKADESEMRGSCLGLLTMITDYGAELGWRFESRQQSAIQIVTTSAVLPLKTLPEATV